MPNDISVKDADSATVIVATDLVSGKHFQVVKLAHGVEDSATFVSTSSGLPVALLASEVHLGEVGGNTQIVTAFIQRPADTADYVAGDVIADSTSAPTLMTFANCARIADGSGVILQATLINSANQPTKGDFDLFLFNTSLAQNNDNTAFTPSDTELATCIGVISFQATGCKIANATSGGGGNCIYPAANMTPLGFRCGSGGTSLFGVLVARSAYTPTSAERFTVRLHISRD